MIISTDFKTVRINSRYSSRKYIIKWGPKRFHAWPLLFNIWSSDLFLFATESDVANYADDNSPYACERWYRVGQLEKDSTILLKWVSINALKAYPDNPDAMLRVKSNILSPKAVHVVDFVDTRP